MPAGGVKFHQPPPAWHAAGIAAVLALGPALSLAFLGEFGFGTGLRVDGTLLNQPRGGSLQQCGDVRRRQRLGDV